MTIGVYCYGVIVYGAGQRLLDASVNGLYVFFGKRLVTEVGVGIYTQGFILMVGGEVFQLARADVGVCSLVIPEEICEPLLYVGVEALRMC